MVSRETVTAQGEYGAVFARSARRGICVGVPLMKLPRAFNLSRITDLSRWGTANTVTSFLIIPSVLARVLLSVLSAVFVLKYWSFAF
jgi:hypothetical protein